MDVLNALGLLACASISGPAIFLRLRPVSCVLVGGSTNSARPQEEGQERNRTRDKVLMENAWTAQESDCDHLFPGCFTPKTDRNSD